MRRERLRPGASILRHGSDRGRLDRDAGRRPPGRHPVPAPGGRPRAARASRRAARGAPLPQGRPHRALPARVPPVRGRVRVRGVPARHPRDGLLRRERDGRVHGGGARGPDRGDRLARRPTLVQRQRRDVRDVVVGVQLAAGRDAPSPGLEGDLLDLRLRRPLRGRRPLLRRRAETARPGRLADLHGRDQRAAAGPAGGRRGLARRVGTPGRRVRAVAVRLARAPAVRRVLEARVAARGLRRDRGGDDARDRMGRRLHQHRPTRHGEPHLPETPPGRSLVARRRRDLAPRPQHRPRPRDGALVGPMAEG